MPRKFTTLPSEAIVTGLPDGASAMSDSFQVRVSLTLTICSGSGLFIRGGSPSVAAGTMMNAAPLSCVTGSVRR